MFEKLREIRKQKGVTAKEIAEKIGLKTEGAYYKKEVGDVPFTLEEGRIISEMIGLPIEEIFFANELSRQDKRKRIRKPTQNYSENHNKIHVTRIKNKEVIV